MNRVNANSNIHADVTSASKLYREEDGEKLEEQQATSEARCILNECKQSVPGMDGPVDHHVAWLGLGRHGRRTGAVSERMGSSLKEKEPPQAMPCLRNLTRAEAQQKIAEHQFFAA